MKKKILIYTIFIFLIILIQSTILDYTKVFNVKPNLLIVLIVSVALLRGSLEGGVVGFFAGLSQDIASGKLLGFYALLGLYLGLLTGLANKRLYRENFLVVVFFTFVATILYECTVYFFGIFIFLKDKTELLFPVRSIILPEAIYNSLVSIFIYIIVVKLNYSFEGINRTSRKY